ncbi:c-type cytochrome biogenesis protein CcmI [Chromatocurvus halotolerans]|uniref:Cytochrome c-type biogenesis protein CcmH n=1 Tax=Chromatocurvus halotolerans TaxID=1132028 RepID=A0A4R2KXK1_9GAMM|nr:c-type cytochrome biogenesis protein CcmI [Chromatocurvus halotolerans]TCO77802.1 cytochrome c-type biogenesis protein CcmH [Chromatocurvus halotolerans]
MTLFLVGCAILLALAALFVLRPGRRGRVREVSEANMDWYALRLRELETDGDDTLVEDARLRMLEDMPSEEQQPPSRADHGTAPVRRLPLLLLWVPVVVTATVLYWQLGSAGDVAISQRLTALDENTADVDIDALMASIESRLEARPDNQGYLALLGRYHMTRENYPAAEQAYRTLAEKAPSDARAAAMAAQASYLTAGRRLTPDAQLLAERALSIDPMQRTALGLLGMAAFEQSQFRAAINYWQRLRELEDPGSPGAEMLDDVIATARSRLGEDGGQPAAPSAGPDGVPGANTAEQDSGVALLVRIERPGGGEIADSDTVFVLARGAESQSRMPIAVQRLRGADLPATVRLDDSNSMAGQTLADAGSLRVFVQVSPNGAPGAENASFTGVSEPVTAGDDGAVIAIELSPTGR